MTTKTATETELQNRIDTALSLTTAIYPALVAAYTSIVNAREADGDELAMREAQRQVFKAMDLLPAVDYALAHGGRSVAEDGAIVREQGGGNG